ncbi:hypothetical protein AVEN_22728-1 [Araneus ventricosus]|uniref:Uncharacterized protein n=1 Tax=Araneus ventricosus TaxID=182803 RepID=A0A4Y2UMC8_ARAVE|nr:hypothetical protein AVEN_22728-1 [Araneus ventricosus]
MTRTTPELASPLQTSAPHQWKDVWPPAYDLTRNRPTNTAELQWNRVSNMEPFGPEAEALSQATSVPTSITKRTALEQISITSRQQITYNNSNSTSNSGQLLTAHQLTMRTRL